MWADSKRHIIYPAQMCLKMQGTILSPSCSLCSYPNHKKICYQHVLRHFQNAPAFQLRVYNWTFAQLHIFPSNVTFMIFTLRYGKHIGGEEILRINKIHYCGRLPPFTYVALAGPLYITSLIYTGHGDSKIHFLYSIVSDIEIDRAIQNDNCHDKYLVNDTIVILQIYHYNIVNLKKSVAFFRVLTAKIYRLAFIRRMDMLSQDAIRVFDGPYITQHYTSLKPNQVLNMKSFLSSILIISSGLFFQALHENIIAYMAQINFSLVEIVYERPTSDHFQKKMVTLQTGNLTISTSTECLNFTNTSCIIRYILITSQFFINLTINDFRYSGFNNGLCTFGGVSLYELDNDQTLLVEKQLICDNSDDMSTGWPTTTFVSQGQYFILVLYIFPREYSHSCIHLVLTYKRTNCQGFSLNMDKSVDKSFIMKSSKNVFIEQTINQEFSEYRKSEWCIIKTSYIKLQNESCLYLQTSLIGFQNKLPCHFLEVKLNDDLYDYLQVVAKFSVVRKVSLVPNLNFSNDKHTIHRRIACYKYLNKTTGELAVDR